MVSLLDQYVKVAEQQTSNDHKKLEIENIFQ